MDGAAWAGRLFLWSGRAMYVGPGGDTGRHSHHAVQITIALEGTITIATADDPPITCEGAVILADVPHTFQSGAAQLLFLYVDAESAAGRRLKARTFTRAELGGLARAVSSLGEAAAVCDGIIAALAGESPAVTELDPRIARAASLLGERLDDDVSLATVAREVGLSPSRLGHLFSEEIGLPIRPYVLWLRLQTAMRAVSGGANLTEAAHAAGFTDSAHLSRTFRRMFGIPPSLVVLFSQFVQATPARQP